MRKLDINQLIYRLKTSHSPVNESDLQKRQLIETEIELLKRFINKISDFSTKKEINGEVCLLIYVFAGSKNDSISNEVYLSPNGFITYQIFDESVYRGYVPDAKIVKGYVQTNLEHFMEAIPLEKIIKFFDERPYILMRKEKEINEKNREREAFIKGFEKRLNDE